MSDAADTEFTTEETLSQAQGNATAFALATIAYLKAREEKAEEMVKEAGFGQVEIKHLPHDFQNSYYIVMKV